jgi:geranylgeranyl reductase family protein
MTGLVDVLVVGAGPAGATAALAALRARPGARVRMLDTATFPRDKTCGDGIAPHALAELALLGVHDVTEGYGPVARMDLRSPGGIQLLTVPTHPTYVIPRLVFDARLVAAAQAAGAELVRHRVRTVEVRDDRVIVDGEHAGRVLIAADGANSTVRRAIGIPRNPDEHLAVAVRGYGPETATDAAEPTQLIKMQADAWPAYAWSFPLANGSGRANVGYGRLRSTLSSRAQLHGELARILPDQPAEELRAHHLPLSTWRPRQPDGRVLLVGDAASLINPLTGEGIFYAVRSGRLAGIAAVGSLGAGAGARIAAGRGLSVDAGAAYRRALRRSLGRHLRHTSLLARLSGHRAALDAALAATLNSPKTMNRLIDLGLGDGLIPASLLLPAARVYLRRRVH